MVSLQFSMSCLITFTFLVTLTAAQKVVHHNCSDISGSFTRNSTYNANLNRLLSTFSSNISANDYGFYNISYGQGPDAANGIALCRGDVNSDVCLRCIKNATTELRNRCSNEKEAIIWYDYCMLRYTNRSIMGVMQLGPYFVMNNTNNVMVTDGDAFNQALSALLDILISNASSGNASGKFATGTLQKIKALVQCTPDLTAIQCGSCLYHCVFSRVRKSNVKLETNHEPNEPVEDHEISSAECIQYDFSIIRDATNDFSDANKLGQGGFGAVYKGKLSSGELIAVKRIATESGQGDVEFINEVQLMAQLQHRNLVRLLGFCLEGNERLLVYEFVPNASLDQFLFDPVKCANLDWEKRYKIIAGIARGLLYLHEDSRLRIIHRNLKASNVLLDAEMNPKISDFGMARLCPLDQTQSATSRIAGTYTGYMAPEYAMQGHFSAKSDVFSYGVLVLELLSGRENNAFDNGENVEDLLSYAWRNWKDGTAMDFVDDRLKDGSKDEQMRCIHIGLLCVQEDVAQRPNMASVVVMLTSHSITLPLPSPSAIFMNNNT
ncbi:hypothetical protein COLO4_25683 [Corchorus olitorius]|uniref:Protein kinase domain-containing protein n=1 Tax=Corchorus olitorius TaxID=93759 RepID=A0A1R3I0E6_9ROSI|nr:hypothetical protein COLO4_25683 [Corchorus olitorius]